VSHFQICKRGMDTPCASPAPSVALWRYGKAKEAYLLDGAVTRGEGWQIVHLKPVSEHDPVSMRVRMECESNILCATSRSKSTLTTNTLRE